MNFEITKTKNNFKKTLCGILAFFLAFACLQPSFPTLAAYTDSITVIPTVTSGNITDGNITGGNVTSGNIDGMTLRLSENGEYYYVSECSKDVTGALVIPETFNGLPVTTIGKGAFCFCDNLTSISIPKSISTVNFSAFVACDNLSSVYIDDLASWFNIYFEEYNSNPLYRGADLYVNGELLTEIYIPEGVTNLNEYVFCDYKNLTTVTIPDSVISIKPRAFDGCSDLTSINVSDNNPYYSSIDGVLFNKSQTTLIKYPNNKEDKIFKVPDTVTNIEDFVLLHNGNVSTLILGKGMTDVKPGAFNGFHQLNSIAIPVEVKSLSFNAFHTKNLKDIFYQGTKEQWFDLTWPPHNIHPDMIGIRLHYNVDITSPDSHYGEPTTTELTCTTDGTHVYTCPCGYKIQEVYATALGHDYQTEWTIDVESTCKKPGSKSHHCSRCESKTDVTEIPIDAENHNYSDWIIDKNASTTSAGLKHKECTVCGEKFELFAIPQLKCSKPTLVSAQNKSGGVLVTWKKVTGADSYEIYRKVKGGSWAKIGTAKSSATTYTDSKAKSGTTYYYTVRAKNEAGLSSYNTNGVSIKSLATPALKTVSNTSTGVKITWGKVTGVSTYKVYRKTSKSGSWQYIGKTTSTSYTDKTAKKGTSYYYTVQAYSGSVKSSYNADGLSIRRLSAPKISSAVSQKSGVLVKWNKIAGAQGYMVYRQTGNGSYTKLATVKGISKISYVDKSAKKGKKYTYKVKAYYGSSYSAYSNTKSVTDKY